MPFQMASLRAMFGFLLSLILLASVATAEEKPLAVYTGEWVPYNYQEGREIKGLSTEILRAMCAEAKLQCGINYLPWVRSYKTVQNTRNALLYTVARKPEREHEFLWIGPILPRATYVYARSSLDHLPTNAQELSSLRVGVVRGEASITDLERAGVSSQAIVVLPVNVDALRMMARGMIDAMVDTEIGMSWNLRNAGLAPGQVKRVMPLSDVGAYYFALNVDSDPALAQRLQAAVDRLQRSGRINAIVRAFLVTD